MNRISKKTTKIFIILLSFYLTIFLVSIIEEPLVIPWVFTLYLLFYGGYVLGFVFAGWLGIYSGNNYKRRWFLPIVGVFVYFCLFFLTLKVFMFFRTDLFPIPPSGDLEKEFIVNNIIVISVTIMISVLSFVIRLLSKWKIAVVIRAVLIAIVTIAIAVPVGISLNKRYCPTYYKYPDFFIKGSRISTVRDCFGEFDINEDFMCAYYAYTDEQENRWYYTMRYNMEGGVVETISMEIH